MAIAAAYRTFIVELFEPFGPVTVRPMFGGAGIFADDAMIGFASGERVYLKAGPRTRADFEGEGSRPFTFTKPSTGETIVTSYFELPERLYDDGDALAEWTRRAYDAAMQTPAKLRKQTRKSRKPKTRTRS